MDKFDLYMDLIIEWNKKINLTRIIEPEEIKEKHFEDSLTILKYLKNNDKVIDVGTGAGLPGIPIKIKNDSLEVTLLDSLNKRVNFLNEVIKSLNLNKINAVHGRAEEFGQDKNYRENYDVAVARAVAPLHILAEYLIPFVKLDGIAICMKGPKAEEEIKNSEEIIAVLGGKIETIEKLFLKKNEQRNVIIIRKIKNTPEKYPRRIIKK